MMAFSLAINVFIATWWGTLRIREKWKFCCHAYNAISLGGAFYKDVNPDFR